jgi:hypothetical protein
MRQETNNQKSNKNKPKKTDKIDRKLLYDFNYGIDNLDNVKIEDILTFFYMGKPCENKSNFFNFEKYKNFTQAFNLTLKDELDEVEEKEKVDSSIENITIEKFEFKYHEENKGKYNVYLTSLNEIDKIVVYEALPYSIKTNKYFLNEGKGLYATTIKNCFNAKKDAKKGAKIIDVMRSNNVGYFDLVMAPLPLYSEIRRKWGKDDKWMIDGKPLTVVLFELGIAHLIISGKTINKNPLFAIGTPSLTSASIFEYYSDKPLEVWKKVKKNKSNITLDEIHFGAKPNNEYELVFSTNLSTTNSPTTHKLKENWKGEIFPLYKANIISGSNYPSATLMKNAFNKFD